MLRWVKAFFEPTRRDCSDCSNYGNGACDVVDKVEVVWRCPALRDYVRFEGIKLYGRAAKQKEQSE